MIYLNCPLNSHSIKLQACFESFFSREEYIDATSLELRRDSECFYRYIKRDHHQSFAEWLHKKNASHYTPIAPIYQQSLLQLQVRIKLTFNEISQNTYIMRQKVQLNERYRNNLSEWFRPIDFITKKIF